MNFDLHFSGEGKSRKIILKSFYRGNLPQNTDNFIFVKINGFGSTVMTLVTNFELGDIAVMNWGYSIRFHCTCDWVCRPILDLMDIMHIFFFENLFHCIICIWKLFHCMPLFGGRVVFILSWKKNNRENIDKMQGIMSLSGCGKPCYGILTISFRFSKLGYLEISWQAAKNHLEWQNQEL